MFLLSFGLVSSVTYKEYVNQSSKYVTHEIHGRPRSTGQFRGVARGQSMKHLTQNDCNRIATQRNTRPRKRLGYRTPEECYAR